MSTPLPLPPQPAASPRQQAAVPMAGKPIRPAIGTTIRVTSGRHKGRLGKVTGYASCPLGIQLGIELRGLAIVIPPEAAEVVA